MKGKIFFLFFSLFVIDLLVSCKCPKTYTYHSTLTGVDVNIGDTSYVVSSNSEISVNDFRIWTSFSFDINKIAECSKSSFFIQSAYALKCPEDKFITKTNLKNLYIIASADVWGHSSGDTIKNIDSFFSYYTPRITADGKKADNTLKRSPLSDIISFIPWDKKKSFSQLFFIELNSHPGNFEPISFKFVFILNNGEIITKETEPVKLLE